MKNKASNAVAEALGFFNHEQGIEVDIEAIHETEVEQNSVEACPKTNEKLFLPRFSSSVLCVERSYEVEHHITIADHSHIEKTVTRTDIVEQNHAKIKLDPPCFNSSTTSAMKLKRREKPTGEVSIGEVSENESDYDFAILLKSADHEEIVNDSTTSDLDKNLKQHFNREYYRQNPQKAKDEIVRRLNLAGLQTKLLRSINGKQTLIKVKAPQQILEYGADKMRLKKRRQGDLMWVEFSIQMKASFYDACDSNISFIDSERQSIVHHLITSRNGASLNEHSDISHVIVQMFPLHKENLKTLAHNWIYFWKSKLHWKHELQKPTNWNSNFFSRFFCNLLEQPIDAVAEYYGEKVAFYFLWVETYTKWLLLPSIAGCFLFYKQIATKSLDQQLAPVYAIFMALWSAAFLKAWKRKSSRLAYRWGVVDYEEQEITRPEFREDLYLSTATIKRYPHWKRLLKYCVTIPIVLFTIFGISLAMYWAFNTRDSLEEKSINNKKALLKKNLMSSLNFGEIGKIVDGDFWLYLFLTPVLYGLLIPVFDHAFTRLARVLTNWENHKTESEFQSHLILKVFPFRFVHVFASLYYYAFASKDANLLRVAAQLAAFMITGQIWNNVIETGIPLIRRNYIRRKKKNETSAQIKKSATFNILNEKTRLSNIQDSEFNMQIKEQCMRLEQATAKAWEESQLVKYDTFEDYTEMMIQFGYVSFFSIAFPLAPLLALMNNLVEMRTDAFKLCKTKQRPIAHKASGIGIWFSVLQLMSVVAIVTNCVHIAFTTTQVQHYFPSVSPEGKVWVLLIMENVLLSIKAWLSMAISDIPEDVKEILNTEREHLQQKSGNIFNSKTKLNIVEAPESREDISEI